jgi:hypothetical protein
MTVLPEELPPLTAAFALPFHVLYWTLRAVSSFLCHQKYIPSSCYRMAMETTVYF